MRFEFNEDQAALASALDQIMLSAEAGWKTAENWQRFDWSQDLDRTLEENGYYDCASEETLGPLAAAAMVYRLNSLPVAVESAASALLRPFCAPDLPRPIAVIDGEADSAIRFLPVARSLIHIGKQDVRCALLPAGAVVPSESLFAYPMGVLGDVPLEWSSVDVDAEATRNRWRVAVAAEIAGSLKGGLEAVLAHVRDRHQFGRPLGSFQAIQHRLAEAAVTIEASYLLVLKAAQTGDPVDAATALGYVQEATTTVVYDFHQFMGAMGLTLEHPLHRWTYRAKLLRSSLGGAQLNQALIAKRRWGSR
ncbi:MAG: hypothetical protein JJ913_02025 [Rhizobiaceae bacterium]|nr:hypothetical protein [Rhizobiaceae bacterium]